MARRHMTSGTGNLAQGTDPWHRELILLCHQEMMKVENNEESKWSKEGELMKAMTLFHVYYNKPLYKKEVVENFLYGVIDRNARYDFTECSTVFIMEN